MAKVMGSAMIHLPLNPIDHSPPPNYTASTCYLPLKADVTPEEAFHVLQEGLHQTFVQLPWLSGKVWLQSPDTAGWRPGQLEIRYSVEEAGSRPPYQLKFKLLTSLVTYDELKESAFPTDAFEDHDLIWAAFIPDITLGCEVFVSQASFIPGGCLITSAMHHNAGDGLSTFHVVNLWAGHCKALHSQDALPQAPTSEQSDRSLQESIWAREGSGKAARDIHPNVWRLLGLDPAHLPPIDQISNGDKISNGHKISNGAQALQISPQAVKATENRGLLKSVIFYMPPAGFASLQKECVQGVGATAPVSGTHAICALVWRCLEKVRCTATVDSEQRDKTTEIETSSQINILLDGRSGFSDSLPSNYLGNHTVHVQCSMALQKLTSPDFPMALIAGLISENASHLNATTLMEAFTLLKTVPDYDWLKKQKWQGAMSINRRALLITSMLMVPQDQLNFGDHIFGNGGNPDASRPLMGAFNSSGTRLCVVLPRTANGGVEFIVNLPEEEVSLLEAEEEFSRYAMLLA